VVWGLGRGGPGQCTAFQQPGDLRFPHPLRLGFMNAPQRGRPQRKETAQQNDKQDSPHDVMILTPHLGDVNHICGTRGDAIFFLSSGEFMSAGDWYHAHDGEQQGPMSLDALRRLIDQGSVLPADLVWSPGMADWLPASQVPQLARPAIAPAPVAPVVGYASSTAPPASVLGYQDHTAAVWQAGYAGFGLRLAAYIIDSIILSVAGGMLGFATGIAQGFVTSGITNIRHIPTLFSTNPNGVLLFWLYFALMESSPLQATLGKLAVGIIVTDREGRRLSFARATGRTFAKYISDFTFLIGWLMPLWTQQQQALHDKIACTLVMKKPAWSPT